MAENESLDLKEQLDSLRQENQALEKELDRYKDAYNKVVSQNSNLWGLYSNLMEYVVDQTQRKI